MEIEAKCSCGQVGFKSTANPIIQLCCHCSDCRDALGREYATIAFFKESSTEVFGYLEEKVYTAASGNRTVRVVCSGCGTVMFDKSEGFPKLIGVMAQQINAPFEAEPACHVWVKNKLPGVSISAEMKQYQQGIEES